MALALAIAALVVALIGAGLAWSAYIRAGMTEEAIDAILARLREPEYDPYRTF